MERKYPCEAEVKPDDYKVEGLSGKIITVLTEAKCWDCCSSYAHAVELPDEFPEPPGGCDYWMMSPECLNFDFKKETPK